MDREGTYTFYTYDALKRRTATTHNSITMSNVLDAAGNVLQTIRLGNDLSQMTLNRSVYDLASRVTSETNALNGATTHSYFYDSQGQLIKTNTYPDGGQSIETYYLDGVPRSVTGTAVHQVRYEYGLVQDNSIYRSFSKQIRLNSDGTDTSEWMTNYVDAAARNYKTVYAAAQAPFPFRQSLYNNQGQLIEEQDPDSVTTLYQYNGKGELEYTATSASQGSSIDWNYDRITRVVRDATTITGTNVVRAQTYVWETNNSTTSNLVAESRVSTDGLRSWDIRFGLTSQSAFYYPGSGYRVVTNTAPDSSFAISTNYQGQLLSVTRKDSGANQIGQALYSYDAHGRQRASTDARNGTTTVAFNNADQITSATSPAPGTGGPAQTTTNGYDTLGRLTSTTLPDGGTVANEYYPSGELKKTSGARTYPAGYSYDYQGRLKTMTNWTSLATLSGARVTTWNYDTNRGFLLSKAYPDGTGPSYTYSSAGRLKTRVWARGTTTYYTNSLLGDVQGIGYSDSVTPNVVFTLDRLGRATTVVDASGTHILSYLDSGLLLSETNSSGTLAGLSVASTYDSLLRRTRLTFSTNSSSPVFTNSFAYDGASWLTNVSDGTYSVVYSYLANSPLIKTVTIKQGSTTRLTTTKQYDYVNRLTSVSSAPSAASALTYSYQYNSANQRVQRREADSSFWQYQYDALGQVTSGKKYWSDWTPVAGQQFEYVFDEIGNRTSTKAGGDSSGANLQSATYLANSLNQITNRTVPGNIDVLGVANAASIATVNGQSTYRKGEYYYKAFATNNAAAAIYPSITNQAVLAGTTNTTIGSVFVPQTPEVFTYDADGNLTNDGRWMLTWNAENRLIKAESQASAPTASKRKVIYEYDWQGRMARRTEYDGSSGSYVTSRDERYVSDSLRCLSELNATNNTIVRCYLWGLDLSGTETGAGGVGGLIAMNSAANGEQFCAMDGNGNVAALVKAADGTGSANYEYDPFGQTLRLTGTPARDNPFRFSTKRWDDALDFVAFEKRPYKAAPGSWLTRDPIGEAGGVNVYAFVVNDPLTFVDPLGDDFIAVSDRPVEGSLRRFYHYSVQYWISCDDIKLNTEYDIEDWRKTHAAKKKASTQLLADEGWKVWRLKGGTKWKLEDTKVSIIYYSDSATRFAAVYKGTPQEVKEQWAKVSKEANGYKYAEQPGFSSGFKNWPNSRYDVGFDVNNSNTYIRDIVTRSGMTMKELGGSHPGRNSPQPIQDDYAGQRPFKGQAPPQPAAPGP